MTTEVAQTLPDNRFRSDSLSRELTRHVNSTLVARLHCYVNPQPERICPVVHEVKWKPSPAILDPRDLRCRETDARTDLGLPHVQQTASFTEYGNQVVRRHRTRYLTHAPTALSRPLLTATRPV